MFKFRRQVSPLGGILATIENAPAGPVYYYIDMSGYRFLSLQFVITAGAPTLNVEGTVQDDTTAQASCAYDDIGATTFGSATWTTDSILNDEVGKCGGYHYIRVGVVGSGTEDMVLHYRKRK